MHEMVLSHWQLTCSFCDVFKHFLNDFIKWSLEEYWIKTSLWIVDNLSLMNFIYHEVDSSCVLNYPELFKNTTFYVERRNPMISQQKEVTKLEDYG